MRLRLVLLAGVAVSLALAAVVAVAVNAPGWLTPALVVLALVATGAASWLAGRADAERLRQRAAEATSLLAATQDFIVRFDSRLRHLFVNRALLEATGIPREAYIGKTNEELGMPPDLCAFWRENLMKVFETGREHAFEFDYRGADGVPRAYHSRVAPERDAAGRVRTVVSDVRDITDLRRAQDEVRALARFPEENPNPVLRVSPEGVVLYANKAAAPMLEGWGAAVGRPLPDDCRRHVAETLASGASRDVQAACGPCIFGLNLAPVAEAGYVNVYAHNITDRARAREELVRVNQALREANEALAAIIGASPVAIVALDPSHRVTMWNPAAEHMFGWKADEVLGRPIPIVPDDLREGFLAMCARHLGGEVIRDYVTRGRRKDDLLLDVSVSTAPLRDAAGVVTGIVGVVADVTDRKRSEERLAAHRKRLRSLASRLVLTEERARRRIAVFLHDQVGQTLAITKVKASALQAGDLAPAAREVLGEVRALLERAIADTRSLTFDLSPPILYELGFEAAVRWLLDRLHEEHGLRADFENDGEPKPLADDIRVVLFLAVRELLVNVIKHAQASSVKVAVQRADNQLYVRVEDDGRGFDAAAVSGPGSRHAGFGLFSIRERLEDLGGCVEIESAAGRGARALLIAPLKTESGGDEGCQI